MRPNTTWCHIRRWWWCCEFVGSRLDDAIDEVWERIGGFA